MMTWLHMILIALIQGITEFLPISSSGHLILLPILTSLPDQGPFIDIAVHVGTLLAVLIYFWRDTWGLGVATLSPLWGLLGASTARKTSQQKAYSQLLLMLIIGTLPIVILGTVIVKLDIIEMLRSATVIASTSIIFGFLLWWADQKTGAKKLDQLSIKSALIIGCMQVIALVPGTSRSGITMTAARQLGFARQESARFSMLLSIPTILAAASLAIYEILQHNTTQNGISSAIPFDWHSAFIVGGMAFIFALIAIHFLLSWLSKRSMTIFVTYRIILGLCLFSLISFDII